MRWIKKTSAPSSFQKYIKEPNANFNSNTCPKKELRKSLFDEQSGICAYCQQKLPEEKGQPKSLKVSIEHHCEQAICNGQNGTQDKRLDYSNLFAVCIGRIGVPIKLHCDSHKAEVNKKPNKVLPMKINPLNKNHISTIKYLRSGIIKSTNPEFDKELNNILQLNLSYLKDMRRKKWFRLIKFSKNKSGQFSKSKLATLIDNDLAKKNGKFCNHFPGLSEYMLKKICS